ncbi:MAG: alpha/beta fold hydrolase [Candidatus Heimdallarchaeota archaeon]
MDKLKFLIYFYGFASGPDSRKASFIRERIRGEDQIAKFFVYDYISSETAFSELRLSRLFQKIKSDIPKILANYCQERCILLGSSFGGFLAAWFAQLHPEFIDRLILMAPALRFSLDFIQSALNVSLSDWKKRGFVLVEHYRYQKLVPLRYSFCQDMITIPPPKISPEFKVPTLILHGNQDLVVPSKWSEDLAKDNSNVTFKKLTANHSLQGQEGKIWSEIKRFIYE